MIVFVRCEISRPLPAIYRHCCIVSTVSIASSSRVASMKVRINSNREGSRVGRSMHPACLRISGPFHLRLLLAFSRRPLKPQTRTAPVGRRRSCPCRGSQIRVMRTAQRSTARRLIVKQSAAPPPIGRSLVWEFGRSVFWLRCAAASRVAAIGPHLVCRHILRWRPDRVPHVFKSISRFLTAGRGVLCCVSEKASMQLLSRPTDVCRKASVFCACRFLPTDLWSSRRFSDDAPSKVYQWSGPSSRSKNRLRHFVHFFYDFIRTRNAKFGLWGIGVARSFATGVHSILALNTDDLSSFLV